MTRIAGLIVLFAGVAGAARSQPEYDLTLVDAFVPGYSLRETYLYDINNQGIAIGTTTGQTVIGISYTGFIWTAAGGSVAEPLSWPHGISNSGLAVAVGTAIDLNTGQSWSLPLLPGTYIVPYPNDINDQGTAVGMVQTCNCSNSSGVLQIPYVWDAVNGARSTPVPNAKGLSRVNANDVAIGWVGGNAQPDSFFVDLTTGQYTMMSSVVPNAGTGSTKALDINDTGVIVGTTSGSGSVYFYGYVYSPASGAQLLPLPPAPYQQAFTPTTINNAGQIAGQIYILGSPRSCVYDAENGFRDLNDPALVAGIPAGFTLMYTTRINDNGWIVGYGAGGGGMYRSFVLRPRNGSACPGDANGDNTVNFADLNTVLSNFGLSGAPGSTPGDVTGDGIVNFADLNMVLSNFGLAC